MADLILGSPTDGNFQGPTDYYGSGRQVTGDCHPKEGWGKAPNCPVCEGRFGQHLDPDCPHKAVEQKAKDTFRREVAEACERRAWLLVDEYDARFTGG